MPGAEAKKGEWRLIGGVWSLISSVARREECVSVQSHLAEAFGEFLSGYLWDWFCTFTFRDLVPSFTAHRRFRYFMLDVEQAAGLPIAWFRADEYGPHGGRLHLHALVSNVAHLHRFTWMNRWEKRNGYARILPFDPERGAAH